MDFWTPVFWNFAHLTDIYQICKSKFLPTTAPILQKLMTELKTTTNRTRISAVLEIRRKNTSAEFLLQQEWRVSQLI